MLHEPLNERFGVAGVPVAYPFVAEEGSEYAALIDDIVGLQRSWSRIPRHGMSALHAGVFRLAGGGKWSALGYLKVAQPARRVAFSGLLEGSICLTLLRLIWSAVGMRAWSAWYDTQPLYMCLLSGKVGALTSSICAGSRGSSVYTRVMFRRRTGALRPSQMLRVWRCCGN